jgi:hypothetical protein
MVKKRLTLSLTLVQKNTGCYNRALERRRRAGRSTGLAALRAACRLPRRLGVRAGSVPTASRREPSVPFTPATSEREPSPRHHAVSYSHRALSCGPSPATLRTQADAGRLTRTLKSGVRHCVLPSSRCSTCRPASAHRRGAAPFRPTPAQADASRSRPRPLQPPYDVLASSQIGSPPEQSSPQSCSLRAADRPAAGAPPPILGHKPVAGKPVVLPHLFPGQGRRRSRPIPASRAALHAKDHIASPSFFPRCFV